MLHLLLLFFLTPSLHFLYFLVNQIGDKQMDILQSMDLLEVSAHRADFFCPLSPPAGSGGPVGFSFDCTERFETPLDVINCRKNKS